LIYAAVTIFIDWSKAWYSAHRGCNPPSQSPARWRVGQACVSQGAGAIGWTPEVLAGL